MQSLRTAIVAACALTVPLAGCGSRTAPPGPGAAAKVASADASSAAAAPNACDVLDEATAKKYLGADAQLRRKAQPNPHMTQCQWGSDRGVINLMVGPWSMVHAGSPEDKPVAGIGDEAYVGPMGLFARKGELGIDLNVMVESGEFWGKAADDVETKTAAAEEKVAPDLVAKL